MKEKIFIIDRIEESFACCEDELGEIWNLPTSLIENASEGERISVIFEEIDDIMEIKKIKALPKTNKKEENAKRLNRLFGKD